MIDFMNKCSNSELPFEVTEHSTRTTYIEDTRKVEFWRVTLLHKNCALLCKQLVIAVHFNRISLLFTHLFHNWKSKISLNSSNEEGLDDVEVLFLEKNCRFDVSQNAFSLRNSTLKLNSKTMNEVRSVISVKIGNYWIYNIRKAPWFT